MVLKVLWWIWPLESREVERRHLCATKKSRTHRCCSCCAVQEVLKVSVSSEKPFEGMGGSLAFSW